MTHQSAFPGISRVYLVALGELTLATAQLRQLAGEHRDVDPRWVGRADQLLGFGDRLDAAIARSPRHENDIRVLMPDGSLVAGDLAYVEQLTLRVARHAAVRRGLEILDAEGTPDDPATGSMTA